MNVVVIAPHPDDEAIGCGGTLHLHAQAGDRITTVFLSSGELGLKELPPQEAWAIREAEAERAASILGIARLEFLRGPDWFLSKHTAGLSAKLSKILDREAADVIYLPHPAEWHPDHKAALPIVRRALQRLGAFQTNLLAYEIWSPLAVHSDVRDITSVLRGKMRAIRCYQSQLNTYRYDRAIRGLNQYRGIINGRCPYAEVFQMLPAVTARATPKTATDNLV